MATKKPSWAISENKKKTIKADIALENQYDFKYGTRNKYIKPVGTSVVEVPTAPKSEFGQWLQKQKNTLKQNNEKARQVNRDALKAPSLTPQEAQRLNSSITPKTPNSALKRSPELRMGKMNKGDAFVSGMLNGLTFGVASKGLEKEITPEMKASYVGGNIAGSIAPYGAISKGVGMPLASKVAKSELGKRVLDGVITGSLYSIPESASRIVQGDSKENIGKNILLDNALGVGLDVVTHGTGKLVKGINRLKLENKKLNLLDGTQIKTKELPQTNSPEVKPNNIEPLQVSEAATTKTQYAKMEGITPSKVSKAEKIEVPSEKVETPKTQYEKIQEPDDMEIEVEVPKTDEELATDELLKGTKDIASHNTLHQDIYRNFKEVFKGEKYKAVKEKILDPLDNAKKANVEMQEKWINDLKENVTKLGIRANSKLSALVMDYGEKNISLEELKKAAPKDWEKVVEADKWFRKAYDELIDTINASRKEIYPNAEKMAKEIQEEINALSADKTLSAAEKNNKLDALEQQLEDATRGKIIGRRSDYYHHFQEYANGVKGLKNIFDTPSQIDPRLVGTSEFTKPKSKFLGLAQERLGIKTKKDAVGGFLDYIKAASYATHIDPMIPKIQGLKNDIAKSTIDSKHLNNFVNFLDKYAQDLAGKTPPLDRPFQDGVIPGGRTTFKAINWLNNRIKKNTILLNASSAVAQLANIPTGIAYVKNPNQLRKGFNSMIADVFLKNKALTNQSGFLKERYAQKLYSQFDVKLLDQPEKFAGWVLEVADQIGTKFIWHSVYQKALKQGIENPIKHADEVTRSLIAGRGIGEVPLIQKSKVFQMVAPFQLDVANLWKVQKDFIKEKDFSALATLYVMNFIFNKGAEAIKGSGVTFDPINAIYEAATEKNTTPIEKLGRLGGEVLSNVPFGNNLAAGLMTPEQRKKYFGKEDPTRFGTGLLVAKGLQNPLYKVLPPLGGGQIEKTIKGVKALNEGGRYDKQGNLMYPVAPTLSNKVKGSLFGQSAFDESKNYYDNSLKSLSQKQTETIEKSNDKQSAYEKIRKQSKIDGIKIKIGKIKNDKNISSEEKSKQIAELEKQLKEIK